MKRLLVPVIAALSFSGLHAQEHGVDLSMTKDDNIFDNHAAVADRTTQIELNASRDWELAGVSLGASYNGSLQLFRDLAARNYHVHLLSVAASMPFEPEAEEDSTSEEDSSAALPPEGAEAESLSQVVSAGVSAASQFDKEEFSQYDNTLLSASAAFRQPLGAEASLRASTSISYHAYPQIRGLTNVESGIALGAGGDVPGGGWAGITLGAGFKSYPTTSTVTLTAGGSQRPGVGKGGAVTGGTRVIDLSTPSVRQLTMTVEWRGRIGGRVDHLVRYVRYGVPSEQARLLPNQLRGALEEQGALGDFVSQNEVFDDHYAYSANHVSGAVEAQLPASARLRLAAEVEHKTYTFPATDLSDTLVLAGERIDSRFDARAVLSGAIGLASGKKLTPRIEFRFLRNRSNAPFYDFEKTSVTVGIEFSF